MRDVASKLVGLSDEGRRQKLELLKLRRQVGGLREEKRHGEQALASRDQKIAELEEARFVGVVCVRVV